MFILYIFGPIFIFLLLIKIIFKKPGELFVEGLGWTALIAFLIVLFIAVLSFSLKKLVPFDPSFKEPLAFIENLIDKFPIKSPFSGLNPGNETVPNSSSNSNNSNNSKDSESSDNSDNETVISTEELSEMKEELNKRISDVLSDETEKNDNVIINRNFSMYWRDFGADTKWNKKDFEKYFFSVYSKKLEFNHITSAEAKYPNIDYTLDLKEKKGKLICTIEFTNSKKFNGTFSQIEDRYVSGPIGQSKQKSSIFNSIKDLFLDMPMEKTSNSMFDEHGHSEEMTVAKLLNELSDPIVNAKKKQILTELATCKYFSDIYTVKLNEKIYLKKEGIVKTNFSDEEIESIFGSTKKKDTTVVKKPSSKCYVCITNTLCYNSSSTTSAIELIQIAENINLDGLIYSNINENARATAQNGKTFFELFEQIKDKDN